MVADVIVVMEVMVAVVLSGSSLSFAAVAAAMVLVDLADAEIAVAEMTAVALSGSYLSFASVAAMVLADVEIPAANLNFVKLINGVACQRRFLLGFIVQLKLVDL